MTPKKRVGILISGRGSNMLSLIEAARAPDSATEIAVVVSNRPEALGLIRAAEFGIPTVAIDHRQFASRVPFEMRLHQALLDHKCDLICNAGFMRLLTGGFVERWQNRHLNIHPSLLPAFPGLEIHKRVLDQGVLITGCTVHFVRVEMDAGPIVAQAAVPVLPDDTEDSLAARVLEAEHKLYPHALQLVAAGLARVENERVVFGKSVPYQDPLFVPPVI
jgi:phosphoribosylglycinamide formyltransferase 1